MEDKKAKKEEYRKVVAKGKRYLVEGLLDAAEGSLIGKSPDTMIPFFEIIKEEYKRRMWEDEHFYAEVNDFCKVRHFKDEKKTFAGRILHSFMKTPSFNRECLKRIDGYTVLPEKYRHHI